MTTYHPTKKINLAPDSVLFIYYLEGTLPRSYPINHDQYLGNWEEDGFSFLFFLQPAPVEIQQLVDDQPQLKLLDQYEMTYRDWQGGDLEPLQIGRFLFSPPWVTQTDSTELIPITLDSGVVFGNGTHPTTATCLEAMEIACHGGKVQTMLDLGTGTGVLALAAAKIGVKRIAAVDFNYLACRTANTNVVLNTMQDSIVVVNGRAEQLLAKPTDLLVANIHYDVMKDLVQTKGFLEQKWFVLSGLLNSETEKILTSLSDQPVHILKKWNSSGVWNTLLGITEGDRS
ncbi:50S ribosomal protein L11 methyltransferase [Desulfopila sp. IMCC35008]|uniref:50S ribosomal protein L11 methyltransferase n=1 Tax=Desulfopila sp. IMCC35008 TaxID=2653858 RepID=UPI0013D01596|nr:50S ribosomal protein L11 methyltransferase [Desulfopila sp. IMCC35008]